MKGITLRKFNLCGCYVWNLIFVTPIMLPLFDFQIKDKWRNGEAVFRSPLFFLDTVPLNMLTMLLYGIVRRSPSELKGQFNPFSCGGDLF
jgi:hypothetical protein